MDKTHNPYELPQDLSKIYQETEQVFYDLLQTGKFDEAQQGWEKLYKLFLEEQEKIGYRLHKGGVVHNLGIIALLKNDIESSFKNFVLGFAEDAASQQQGFGGVAEDAPGARNLKTFFGVGPELFDSIRKIVLDYLSKNQFNNPRQVFRSFLETQIEGDKLKSRIETLRKNPFVIQKRYTIDQIPGSWSKRVFIGGNYRDRVRSLFEIKKIVEEKGYTPIIALEFKDQEPPIHDHSLLLLHNCKHAIFDVSKDSGYLMEVERTLDYRTHTLLVYEKVPEYGITAMMTSFQELKKYSNNNELKKLINDFLA